LKPPLYYSAYGLGILCDRPISGLIANETPLPAFPDLHIRFDDAVTSESPEEETLWYTTYITDANGEPALKIWKKKSGDFSIRYSHGPSFHVDSDLSTISVCGSGAITNADVGSLLLGPVLGILFRLKGFTCLHASAVELCGKAVVFAGMEGSGKSTTAAIFAQRGHAVLADDIAVLDESCGRFAVRPGYPRLNLLPDSVELLYGSSQALPTPDPALEKQQMILGAGELRFQSEALLLGAVVSLESVSAGSAPTSLKILAPQEALIALASNTYANRMLDPQMRAAEFLTLGAVVKSIPVLRLIARQRATDLESLYRAICTAVSDAMMLQEQKAG
jgi:hypothetical protein